MKIIFRYLKYILTSKSYSSIQGPFIFNLMKNVIFKKERNDDFLIIEKLRKRLHLDSTQIKVSDFGAGSKINQSKTRKIKDIAKNSAKNKKFGRLLYRLTKYYKPDNILELGTSLAISTAYLAKGNPNGKILSLEGCENTAKIASENLKKLKIKNVELIVGEFEKTLDGIMAKIKKVDLVFVDGNHQKKPTLIYFEKILNYTNNNTILIFDDIHWSHEMEEAWQIIQDHSAITTSIDLFFIGIAFVNPDLSKEKFKIRF